MKKHIILLLSMSTILISCGTQDKPQKHIPETKNIWVEVEASKNSSNEIKSDTPSKENFTLEAWADNWFAAYLGDELIGEDSVSINTERSFNSETMKFSGSYPLHLNVILKDYKENDTGLEYIGSNRQQMGDGGFVMQIKDSSWKLVAVTNDSWKCKVIHDAPIDKSCESSNNPQQWVEECASTSEDEPTNWKSPDFDDSSWSNATVHSTQAVDPKIGYDDINWDSSVDIIWGPDLETNNTILCKTVIQG